MEMIPKYLGGSNKDFYVRKALAWTACHKLKKVWKSSMNRKLKIRLFLATVESVLLYGSQTWTIDKSLQNRLDGCYTRMLRMALDICWTQKLTNKQLYGELPPVPSKVAYRRMLLAGHCVRHPEEEASKLVLWHPKQGKRKKGRQAVTYIDTLMEDTGIQNVEELRTAMMDRNGWRSRAASRRAQVMVAFLDGPIRREMSLLTTNGRAVYWRWSLTIMPKDFPHSLVEVCVVVVVGGSFTSMVHEIAQPEWG